MSAPKAPLVRAAACAAALLGACVALVPAAARTYGVAVSQLAPLARRLSTTTLEDRRRAAYGDCDGLGYGYVSEILRAYPDDRSRPLVKWATWPRKVHLVLAGERTRVDERVLIGIGLSDAHFAPHAIAAAIPRGERRDGESAVTRWGFATRVDYDLLSGFSVELRAAPPAPTSYEITLVHSATSPRVIDRWNANAPAGEDRFVLALPEPVSAFSYGRGATEFIVEARSPVGAPGPARVVPIGANVDGRGYVVVHRRGSCLTAVRSDLLSAAQADASGGWARFVETLRNAR